MKQARGPGEAVNIGACVATDSLALTTGNNIVIDGSASNFLV
jgi:hypothetical protein